MKRNSVTEDVKEICNIYWKLSPVKKKVLFLLFQDVSSNRATKTKEEYLQIARESMKGAG